MVSVTDTVTFISSHAVAASANANVNELWRRTKQYLRWLIEARTTQHALHWQRIRRARHQLWEFLACRLG